MNIRMIFLSGLIALFAVASPITPARAQGDLFTPAVFVNDRVITRYEIEQNRLFLGLLRQPGNVEELAVERLIEDRLRFDAAAALGISASEEEVIAGMTEFAGRANLTLDEFVQVLGRGGVAPETFRSFVEAGQLWRQVVRARFGPRAQVTDAEIDRAIALSSRQSGVQVLISEIVLAANNPTAQAQAESVAQRLAGQTLSEGAFAAEARTRSVSPSRARGGRLDWLPLSNLPPPVAAQVIGLAPGQVSQPYPVNGAIVLFYLRDLRETGLPEEQALSVEWAEYAVTDLEQARRLKGEVDTCDDLYGVALNQPEDRLLRDTRALAEVPQDVVMELAQLDENEVSAEFSRGGQPVLLMLCGRTFELPEDEGPSREEIRNRLISQRLASYADGYLAELRADATIRMQ